MNLTSLANRSFSISVTGGNYKELYEETKKKTAAFIQLVDQEISKILAQHKKQKDRLEQENYMLREQLKLKDNSTFPKSANTQVQSNKISNGCSLQEFASDIINCGISEISHVDAKSLVCDKQRPFLQLENLQKNIKKTKNGSKNENLKSYLNEASTLNLTNRTNKQKQNKTSCDQITSEALQLSQLRQKYYKKQRSKKDQICKLIDKQQVGDLLKKIRQRSLTPKASSNFNRHDPTYLEKNIITPNMYKFSKN